PDDLDHLVYAHDALLLTACQPLTPAHGTKRCRSSPFSSEPCVQHPPLRHMMDPPAEHGKSRTAPARRPNRPRDTHPPSNATACGAAGRAELDDLRATTRRERH